MTSRLSWFPCFCCLDFCANLLEKCARNISKKSALENCASTLRIRTVRTSFKAALRPRFLCKKKQNAASKKMPVIHLENCAEKYSPYGPRFLCCTACVRPRNSCRVWNVINAVLLVFCALLDLKIRALQTVLYSSLENRALLPFFSLSSLSFS